ncbi:hypothetical protein AB0D67_12850 [Streptosporangium sp. NPDC048047]
MPAQMRAVSQRTYGGPEVLEIVETGRGSRGPGRSWSACAPPG